MSMVSQEKSDRLYQWFPQWGPRNKCVLKINKINKIRTKSNTEMTVYSYLWNRLSNKPAFSK